MAVHTLSILKPSVNNLTTRIFVRAAGLEFAEEDVWGKKSTPEFLAKGPADLTPLLEEAGLPKGALWESCAIMQYLCNKHRLDQFYHRSQRAGHGRQRDVLPHRHGLSPRRARDLPRARLPAVRGRGRHRGRLGRAEGEGAGGCRGRDRGAAEVYRAFFLDGKTFIGGDTPSIADMRLAATLEFLRAIDYDFPAWAEEYIDPRRRWVFAWALALRGTRSPVPENRFAAGAWARRHY